MKNKEGMNPFKISIASNEVMGGYDVTLQVGGLKDEAQAKRFADILTDWLVEGGAVGWFERVQ